MGTNTLAYGLPWEETPKVRVERLAEAIQIIRGMWTQDRFTFKGKYYSVNEAACLPKPIQKPSIKIIVGGKGEKLLLRAVAKYADGWNIDELPTEEYAHKLQMIRDHCARAGTDYDRIEKSLEQYVLISDNPDQEQHLVDWTNEQSAKNPERQRLGKPESNAKLDQLRKEYIFGTVGTGHRKICRIYQSGRRAVHDLFSRLSHSELDCSLCKRGSPVPLT